MALDLFEEFKHVVLALDDAGIEHAVVGALAVAIHGAPRATTDIDLLIAMKVAAGRPRDLGDVASLEEMDR